MSSIAIQGGRYKYAAQAKHRNSALNRLFLLLVVLLMVILSAELAFHFYVAPKLLIRHIELNVGTDFPLSNDELVRLSGMSDPTYYYSASTAKIEANLESDPLIKSAAVQKIFPNTLRITITERAPLVLSLVNTGSVTEPVAFDADGVAVEIGGQVKILNMPIISGITIPTAKLGMRLPEPLVGFLQSLAALKTTAPGLYSLISEIRFEKRGTESFDAILYPVAYRVPVRIGGTIDENQLKYIMMVLNVVQTQGMADRLAELDFRTGQVVYKLKEGK